MTSEAKNKYAYVIRQKICNKFIEVKFSVGCMVWVPNRLFQDWTSFGLLIRLNSWCIESSALIPVHSRIPNRRKYQGCRKVWKYGGASSNGGDNVPTLVEIWWIDRPKMGRGGGGAKAPQPPRLRRACVYFHAISSYKHHCRIKSPYGYDYVTGSEMCRDQDMFQTLVFYLI